ncbi:MAG: SDR family NAD(P)-dependent oxidoreductase [Lachnospiraceae bacterium]|nr:SDR family NAD(P)-dependent oxidoreductase [Lachnospiraceae bacterium]
MFKDYKDKVVVVTGAAHGIGKELAIGCARRGADVLISDILGDELAPVAEEIEKAGRKAVCVTADVSLQEDCMKIFAAAMEHFGRCDFLINNAGVSAHGVVTEIVEQDIHWVTETNFYSHWYMMKPFITQMMEQKSHCQILNVCSIAGLYTMGVAPVYFATKHAAVVLSESTWKWLKQTGADIDLVCCIIDI